VEIAEIVLSSAIFLKRCASQRLEIGMAAYLRSFQIAMKFWPTWPIFQLSSVSGNRQKMHFFSSDCETVN